MNPERVNFVILRENNEDNWLYFLGNLIENGSVIIFDRFEQKPISISPYYTVVPSTNQYPFYLEYILYNQKYLKEYTVFIKNNTIKSIDDYYNIIDVCQKAINESCNFTQIGNSM
jgi:hypothetical protein